MLQPAESQGRSDRAPREIVLGTKPITTYKRYTEVLRLAAQNGVGLPTLGLSKTDIQSLNTHATNQNSNTVERRIAVLPKKLPSNRDPFEYVVAGDLKGVLPKFRDANAVQIRAAVHVYLADLPFAVTTPEVFIPEKAQEGEVLTDRLLEEAFYYVVYSREGSVASQLEDPIEVSRTGIAINMRTSHYEDNYNKGYKLPVALLDILKTLKYEESGKVFGNWILRQCSQTDEEFEATIRFLSVFVNFTSFLDSLTHMELWKPPAGAPQREREFVLQAFRSIKYAIDYTKTQLVKARASASYLDPFNTLDKLIRLRFGEVFAVHNRTSLYTAAERTLTPAPQDFAELAVSMIENQAVPSGPRRIAAGLIKLADSIGIQDIKPLIKMLSDKPRLQAALEEEAKREGLIRDKKWVEKVHQTIEDIPWQDTSEINFANVIKEDLDFLDIYVFTGTFGPFTKGHKDLVDRLISHVEGLPDKVGNKIHQRIILIVPVIDASVIENYSKSTARTGTIYERVTTIMLHLTLPDIPRDLVFMTTRHQPDPNVPKNLEERVRDTVNALNAKITSDLRNAPGRSAGFTSRFCYTVGPDEFRWEKPEGITLAPRETQRDKVLLDRGIVIVRRGSLFSVLNNLPAIQTETGIEHVILTPGTPFSSSTGAIKDIAAKGVTRFVSPAAKDYVVYHYSKSAITRRRVIDPLKRVPSVGEISKSAVPELERLRV